MAKPKKSKKQKMPRSMAVTLRCLRVRAGDSTSDRAEALTANKGRFGKKIEKQQLSDIERANVTLTYWWLSAYGKIEGHPIGGLFLVSRLAAELRDGNCAEARAVLMDVERLTTALLKPGVIEALSEQEATPTEHEFLADYDDSHEEDGDTPPIPKDERERRRRCALMVHRVLDHYPNKHLKAQRKTATV